MCYQKYHDCKYCKQPYTCDENDYTCPTINHDFNMDMCPACHDKLEEILEEKDLEAVNLMNIDIEDLLR
jgi:Zn finger protein HypA/HybF involved in hydrogenase expression